MADEEVEVQEPDEKDLKINDNIKKFEEKHGEIATPGQDSFQEFGVKPPESNLPN